MISPSNTGPTLTSADTDAGGIWQPGYYRTAHNDLFQGRVAAEFLYNELGITSLATIHDGSPYAESLAAVAAEVFAELGGEVTFEGAVNVGDTDMRPILTEIASNPPDVLYFPVFEPESNFIAAQANEIAGSGRYGPHERRWFAGRLLPGEHRRGCCRHVPLRSLSRSE